MPTPRVPSERARWPAMAVSVGIHVLILLLLFGLVPTRRQAGTSSPPAARSIAMAIAHRLPDRTQYLTEPEDSPENLTAEDFSAEGPSASEPPVSQTKPQDPSEVVAPPIDLSEILAEMTGRADLAAEAGSGPHGASTADGLIAGRIRLSDGRVADQLGDSELIPGIARSGRGAGRMTTEVFGVAGTGSTFVYVFDRSGSMAEAGSAPLRAAKSELIRSLETLTERQQFQIIFYNDTPHVFRSQSGSAGLVTGEPATIARARAYVQQTTAFGGTEHELALRMALRMAPEVIFFLTDAVIQTMSEKQLDDITRRAEDAGTTIHAIQFGSGPAPENSFLERLIKKNGGGYRYVDVTSLR